MILSPGLPEVCRFLWSGTSRLSRHFPASCSDHRLEDRGLYLRPLVPWVPSVMDLP
jgi:hypothetical protein